MSFDPVKLKISSMHVRLHSVHVHGPIPLEYLFICPTAVYLILTPYSTSILSPINLKLRTTHVPSILPYPSTIKFKIVQSQLLQLFSDILNFFFVNFKAIHFFFCTISASWVLFCLYLYLYALWSECVCVRTCFFPFLWHLTCWGKVGVSWVSPT